MGIAARQQMSIVTAPESSAYATERAQYANNPFLPEQWRK